MAPMKLETSPPVQHQRLSEAVASTRKRSAGDSKSPQRRLASRVSTANTRDGSADQRSVAGYQIYLGDAFAWMMARNPESIHAIVTDPPYGLKEYSEIEQGKLRRRNGGIWRIPPSFDGCRRSPVPRFTVLDETDRAALRSFFSEFAVHAMRVLVPCAHVLVATNPSCHIWCICRSSRPGLRSEVKLYASCRPCAAATGPKTRTKNFLM